MWMENKMISYLQVYTSSLRQKANAKRKLTLPDSGANFKLMPLQSDNSSSLPSADSLVLGADFADKEFLNFSSLART